MPNLNVIKEGPGGFNEYIDDRAEAVVNDALTERNPTYTEFLTNASANVVTIQSGTYTVPNDVTVDSELRGATREWVGGVFVRDDSATFDGGVVISNNAGHKYVRQWDGVNIVPEFYRIGLNFIRNDVDAINRAGANLTSGGTISLKTGKTYWGKTVSMPFNTRLVGGTIKRIELPSSLLTVQANAGATSVTVADGSIFSGGMLVHIADGVGFSDLAGASAFQVVSVSGNVVTLNTPITHTMPVGSVLFHTVFQLGATSISQATDANITIENVVFDGNRTQNPHTQAWTLNGCIYLGGYHNNVRINNCTFRDIPGDAITVAGKAWVTNCAFHDIYGACVHGSAANSAAAKGVVIENCHFNNVCLSTAAEHGHGPAVGVYLQSNLTRDVQFLNCRIEGIGGNVVNYMSEGLVIQGCYIKDANGIFGEVSSAAPRQAPRIIGNAFVNVGNLYAGGFVGSEHLLDGIVISGNYFKNSAIRVGASRHSTITNNAFEFDSTYQTRFAAGDIQDLGFNAAVVLGGEVTFTGNRLINSAPASASLQRGVYMMGFDTPSTSYTLSGNTVQGFLVAIENALNTGTEVTPWKNVCTIVGNSITLPDVAGTRRGILSYASGVTIANNSIHSLRTLAAEGIYASGANNDITSGAIGCKVLNNIVTGCQFWLVTEWYCNVIDGNTFEGSVSHQNSSTRQTIGINTELTTSGVDRKTRTTIESVASELISATSSGSGSANLVKGNGSSTGFIEWVRSNGTRQAYAGFDSGDNLTFVNERPGRFDFNRGAKFSGLLTVEADGAYSVFINYGTFVGSNNSSGEPTLLVGRAVDNTAYVVGRNINLCAADDANLPSLRITNDKVSKFLYNVIFTPPSSVSLSNNNEFSIEMTSNTAGNLVYRGSDGTTRRMALTFS